MKTIKRIGITMAVIAVLCLLLLLLVVVFLGSPKMQTKIIGYATEYVEEGFGVRIGIGYMNLTMDGGLRLKEVFLPDENGDTLAYIHSLKVKTNPLTTYKGGKLKIGSVSIDSVKAYIWADSVSGRFCFDYLAERFGGDADTANTDTSESTFDLAIGEIELNKGKVTFDYRGTGEKNDGTIDFNHICADDVNLKAALESIDLRTMAASVRHLSAKMKDGEGKELFELRGLSVKDFACDTAKGGIVRVGEIGVQAKKTDLSIKDVYLTSKEGLEGIDEAIEKGEYGAKIHANTICLPDFKAFAPILGGFKRVMMLDMEAEGKLPSVAVKSLKINDGRDLVLEGRAEVDDYTDIENARIEARINSLMASREWAKYAAKASGAMDTLPQVAIDILPFSAKMEAKGLIKNLDIKADLGCALGLLGIEGNVGYAFADSSFTAKAHINSDNILLKPIADSAGVDSVAFNLYCGVRTDRDGLDASAMGKIERIVINGRQYSHLRLDTAVYNEKTQTAEARVRMKEEFGWARIMAKAEMGMEVPRYTAKAKILNFTPEVLGIVDSTWKGKSVSLDVDCELNFKDIEKIDGYAYIDSVVLANGGNVYNTGNIRTTFSGNGDIRRIETRSDLADITFDGKYELGSLEASVCNILHSYVPTFFDFKQRDYGQDSLRAHNAFRVVARVKDMSPVFGFMGLPIKIASGADATFRMADSLMRLGITGYVPSIEYEKMRIEGTKFSLKQNDNMYVANVEARVSTEGVDPISVSINTEMENDVFLTKIKYDNGEAEVPLMGELGALISFPRDTASGELTMRTYILPGDILIDSLLLGMDASVIDVLQSGETRIGNFGLIEDDKRILNIDGTIGERRTDSLVVALDSMSISDVLSKLNLGVPVSGVITGGLIAKGLLSDSMSYRTNKFKVENLVYDGSLIGDVRIRNGWSAERGGMGMRCDITRKGKHICEAKGHIIPKKDELHFKCTLDEIPIDIAETAMTEFVSDIAGSVSANFNVSGKISEPLLDGCIHINNAKAKIKNTGCIYTINDSIKFTPTKMMIHGLKIKDGKEKTATLNCEVEHRNFKDFKYKGKLALDSFQVLNNPKAKEETAHGDFGLDGLLAIRGDEDGALFVGKLTATDNSAITIVLPKSETNANKFSNIVFVSKDTTKTDTALANKMMEKRFKLEANVDVELKDDMKMSVVLDKQTGDYCEVKGIGSVRAEYSSQKNDVALYGTYTISHGQLKMKISKLPLKPFAIDAGSNIYIGGPLSSLNFDLSASYTTKADLATLDESFVGDPTMSQTRVPAAAVLSVKGNMDKFDLGYDITLPGANEELKQRVKGIVNTDELRIKEFAYLIALNSFYTISGNTAAVGSTMISNVAGQSISNGLNTLLGDVLGSSWTVGADITSTESDMSDMEMSFTLSRSFFNDRLMFSTDVGYQNQTQSGGSNAEFTNSFDLEYKLTKNGMFRLKGYRHANDEFYRLGTHTEGVGIVITKEAETMKGLFQLKQK